MRLILHDVENVPLDPNEEEVIPICWNYDHNLLIGEAAVTFVGNDVLADVTLFEDLVPEWFAEMLHDCPDCWGTTMHEADVMIIGVMPPTETDLTLLVIEMLAEFNRENP